MSTTRFTIATAVGGADDDAEHGRQVLGDRAVEREPAEPLDVEDRLGDDRTADEQRDVEAEDRHDRRQARAQPVLEDHARARRAPSRARCGCSPRRASRAGCSGSAARRSRCRGGRARSRAGSCARTTCPTPSVDRRVARPAREAELLPDDVEGHQPEPEDGRTDPEEREAHRRSVDDRASPDRGDHPDRDPEDEPDGRGAEDQEQRPRRARRCISLRTET